MDDKAKIQVLSYALGMAIGGLELIQATPYDFNKEGLDKLLKRLKLMAEEPVFYVELPKERTKD